MLDTVSADESIVGARSTRQRLRGHPKVPPAVKARRSSQRWHFRMANRPVTRYDYACQMRRSSYHTGREAKWVSQLWAE